jgi:uncharacterized phage protein (TIGR02218 family)
MAGNQFLMAELYTFTLIGGTVLRYGDYDPALAVLVANGNAFPASGLKFKRTRTRQAVGLEVGSVDLEIFADANDATSHVNGISFQAFVLGGGLDGAIIEIDRCFMASWGDCAANGTLRWFYGRASDATPGRTSIKLTVKDLTEILNVTVPRDVYQPGCLNTLYDLNTCTLVKSSFAVAGTVASGSSAVLINSGLANAAGDFDLGTITFTSGVNNGLSRSVKSYADNGLSAGQIALYLPLLAAAATGDTFNIYPGCDKTMARCSGRFANLANFRGQPFIPVPETAR